MHMYVCVYLSTSIYLSMQLYMFVFAIFVCFQVFICMCMHVCTEVGPIVAGTDPHNILIQDGPSTVWSTSGATCSDTIVDCYPILSGMRTE